MQFIDREVVNVNDPVAQGVVASLAHPGGNITGITLDDSPEITAKRMQFLKDAIPHAAKVAVLTDSDTPYRQVEWQELGVATRSLNVMLRRFLVRQAPELEQSFAAMEPERPDVLLLTANPFFNGRRIQLVQLATRCAVPASYSSRDFAEAGGLMSYGANIADAWRQAGSYTGKLLK